MSGDARHTPGPWCVEDPMGRDMGYWIVQSNLPTYEWGCIATVHHDHDNEGGRQISFREQTANANLIAAAPDMLAALNLVWNKVLTEYHSKDSYVRQQVEAAIAKAEGRS